MPPLPPVGQKCIKIHNKIAFLLFNAIFVIFGGHDPGCGRSKFNFTKITVMNIFK